MCEDPNRHHHLHRRQVLKGAAAAGGALAAGRLVAPGVASASTATDELTGMGEDPVSGLVTPSDATLRAAITTVSVPAPRIITRAEWGADESIRTTDRGFAPIRKAIVHHTAGTTNPSDPAAEVNSIYRYHVLDPGRQYADIGYNFLVDQRGGIYEGRWARAYAAGELHDGEDVGGNGVVGAHALNFNTGTVGICLLGDFTDTRPTDAAIASLVHLIAWKLGPRGIDPLGRDSFTRYDGQVFTFPNIAGHRDVGQTACPGDSFYPVLATVRSMVAARLQRGLVGYRILGRDGTVMSFGGAADKGDPRRAGVANGAAIGSASVDGYYVVSDVGEVYAYGSATSYGSLVSLKVRTRATDVAVVPGGSGYWLLAADGGVFSFGSAKFWGSLPGIGVRTNTAIRLRTTPSGNGYWLLGADGGIFCFGDAQFWGSVPGLGVRTAVADLAPTPTGKGYWVLGKDGGVFCFGDAKYFGSVPGLKLPRWSAPAVALMPAYDGGGYHVLASDGGVFSFGSVPFFGSAVGSGKVPAGIAPAIA